MLRRTRIWSPRRIHASKENYTMANSYDKQPKLGIPAETAGPLIALVITCISALVVVLVLLAKDKRPDEPVRD